MIGKDSKKKEMIKHMDRVFSDISSAFSIPAADFPDPETFADKLKKMDFNKFSAYDRSVMERVDRMLTEAGVIFFIKRKRYKIVLREGIKNTLLNVTQKVFLWGVSQRDRENSQLFIFVYFLYSP